MFLLNVESGVKLIFMRCWHRRILCAAALLLLPCFMEAAPPKKEEPTPAQQPAPLPPLPEIPIGRLMATQRALFETRQFGLAAEGYLDLLKRIPEMPKRDREEIFYQLGECYRQLGRMDDAAKTFDLVLAEFPDGEFSMKSMLRKGEILFEQGKHDDALALFRVAASNPPNAGIRLNAQFHIVETLQNLNRLDDALPVLEALSQPEKGNPYRAWAFLGLGRHAECRNNMEAALSHYQQALALAQTAEMRGEAGVLAAAAAYKLRQFKEAIALFETVRRSEVPERWRKYSVLGLFRARFAAGNHAELLEFFNGLQKAGGWTESASEEGRPEILYNTANSCRSLQKMRDALAHYDDLLKMFPKSVYAEPASYERLLVLAIDRSDKLADEAQAFLDAYPSSSKTPDVQYLKADFLFSKKNYLASAEIFKNIILDGKPEPVQEDAHYKLGWALFSSQQFAESAKVYSLLVEKFPKSQLVPESLWMTGLAMEQMEDFQSAMSSWGRLAEQFASTPQAEHALYRKGLLHGKMKDWTAACAVFSEWLKRHPKNAARPEVLYRRGLAAFEQKDFKGAIDDLKGANVLDAKFIPMTAEPLVFAAYNLKDAAQLEPFLDAWDQCRMRGQCGERTPPAPILFWLAKELEVQGKWAKTEDFYLRVMESGEAALRPQSLYGAGVAQVHLGKFAPAIKNLENYQAENPASAQAPQVLIALSRAYHGEKQFDKAQAFAEDLMRLVPEGTVNAEARMALADALMGKQDFAGAAKYYASVTLLYDDPSITPEAFQKAANAYRLAGNEEDASRMDKEGAGRKKTK